MAKRILVSSISGWSQKSGANTWSSLLSFADPEDVASIYINPGIPDSATASRYFNINEISVVKSLFSRKIKTGREVVPISSGTPAKVSSADRHGGLISFLRRKRFGIILWLRELAWKFGRWRSPELDDFIVSFRPDVFIFSIESYPYFNRLNEYIIDRYKPRKVVSCLWDDNFTYRQYPHSLTERIERFFLRKSVRRLVAKSSTILATSPKMKAECDAEFNIDSVLITKPIFKTEEFKSHTPGNPVRILYTGNLHYGRYDTIRRIAEAVRDINGDETGIELHLYTSTQLSSEKRKAIECCRSCVIHDPVPQAEVLELQKEADILLFAESLSGRKLTARLSFSTKLTDYFAAGKCIWAVGNSDLGPISYLKDEDAGIVSSTSDSISKTLSKLISDRSLIEEYSRKSYECGLRNHNAENILNTLRHDVIGYDSL